MPITRRTRAKSKEQKPFLLKAKPGHVLKCGPRHSSPGASREISCSATQGVMDAFALGILEKLDEPSLFRYSVMPVTRLE
jgi:hypothetical protein